MTEMLTLERLLSSWRNFAVQWYGKVDFSVRTLLHVWFVRRGLRTPDYYLAEEPWNFYRHLMEVLGDPFKARLVVGSLVGALARMGCRLSPDELVGALSDFNDWKRVAPSLIRCASASGESGFAAASTLT